MMDRTILIPEMVAYDEDGNPLGIGDHFYAFDLFGNPPQDRIYILESYQQDENAYIGRECSIH